MKVNDLIFVIFIIKIIKEDGVSYKNEEFNVMLSVKKKKRKKLSDIHFYRKYISFIISLILPIFNTYSL